MLLQNKNVINQCKAVADNSTDKLNQETSKLSSETDERMEVNQKFQFQWRLGEFTRTKKVNSVKKCVHPYQGITKRKKNKDSLKVGLNLTNNLRKIQLDA